MIVVDTSVWSLLFRREPAEAHRRPAAVELRRLIEAGAPVALPGIVLQELLSGIRRDTEFTRLQGLLAPFPLVLAQRQGGRSAARAP